MSVSNDLNVFRKTIDRLYLDPTVPAWKSTLEYTKTYEAKEKIRNKFLKICLTVESDMAPYPTKREEVKPYWTYVLGEFVTESKLAELNERIRAVAKVIVTNILGKVLTGQDNDNMAGLSLKSMIESVGVKNTVNFISIIELETTKKLVQKLEAECPGLIDRLVNEDKE